VTPGQSPGSSRLLDVAAELPHLVHPAAQVEDRPHLHPQDELVDCEDERDERKDAADDGGDQVDEVVDRLHFDERRGRHDEAEGEDPRREDGDEVGASAVEEQPPLGTRQRRRRTLHSESSHWGRLSVMLRGSSVRRRTRKRLRPADRAPGTLFRRTRLRPTTMGMGSDMYRQQILDHYKNPRNKGEMDDPTFSHTGENPSCGDTITMNVKLDDDGETIEFVSFTGDGCAISQASASMLTSELQGMTLDELEAMETEDVTEMLGVDISPMRIKCAVLAEKVAQDGAKLYEGEIDVDRTTTEE
jgi:nitrogen fixation NifU-like protein